MSESFISSKHRCQSCGKTRIFHWPSLKAFFVPKDKRYQYLFYSLKDRKVEEQQDKRRAYRRLVLRLLDDLTDQGLDLGLLLEEAEEEYTSEEFEILEDILAEQEVIRHSINNPSR